jgi:hypothetical protein
MRVQRTPLSMAHDGAEPPRTCILMCLLLSSCGASICCGACSLIQLVTHVRRYPLPPPSKGKGWPVPLCACRRPGFCRSSPPSPLLLAPRTLLHASLPLWLAAFLWESSLPHPDPAMRGACDHRRWCFTFWCTSCALGQIHSRIAEGEVCLTLRVPPSPLHLPPSPCPSSAHPSTHAKNEYRHTTQKT